MTRKALSTLATISRRFRRLQSPETATICRRIRERAPGAPLDPRLRYNNQLRLAFSSNQAVNQSFCCANYQLRYNEQ